MIESKIRSPLGWLTHPPLLTIACVSLLICSGGVLDAVGEDEFGENAKPDQPKAAVVSAGEITHVTLFRDSALVTRLVSLTGDEPLAPGAHEILVTELPEQLITSSVFAEGDASASIRAVRVVQEPIRESSRKEVQELDEQLNNLRLEAVRLTSEQLVSQQNLATLDQMVSFSRQAADGDLNRGVLDAKALTELLTYSMRQRAELNQRILEIENEIRQTDERVNQITRERSRLTDGNRRTRYEARVFVDVNEADVEEKMSTIRLSYSVDGCGWSPQYTINGSIDSDQFTMRYGAIIGQLSGESWDGVQLTLSTTSPLASASGPSLAPLRVRTTDEPGSSDGALNDLFEANDSFGADEFEMEGMEMGMDNQAQRAPMQAAMPSQLSGGSSVLQSKMQSLRSKQRSVEQSSSKVGRSDQAETRDLQLNRLADEMQNIEFMASARKARGLASDAFDEVATQTYPIEGPVSLESRREQQLVEIAEKDLSGSLYHVAIPLLSSFAYREAELVNELPFGLLSGPASIYLDDRFVGTMTIPTTASGQRLLIGFGADGQVRTRRELLEKSDAVQGGNRKIGFEYRLVLSNFKETEVNVRLFDRIPLSGQSEQIRVELGDVSIPISDDKLYGRVRQPYGLLRWDVVLGASMHGSDATDIKYGYTVEFDRSRMLSVEPTVEEEVVDFFMPGGMPGGMGGGMGGGGGP